MIFFLPRRGAVRFTLPVVAPPDIDGLSPAALKQLVETLLQENAEQRRVIGELREEVARLKGLKGRPRLRSSGMEEGTAPRPPSKRTGRRGKVTPRVSIEEKILRADVPAGSRFKGYEDVVVQDLVLRMRVIRYRRERWLTPDGRTVIASLPAGISGHFGPELRRFVLAQYHQGQVTVPRLMAQLRAIGVSISKRQVMRLLIAGQDEFLAEAREVLRAGYTDYAVNDAALAYMRQRALAGPIIAQLAEHPDKRFADQASWQAHLDQLGITALNVTPDPVQVATEGALWGSVQAHDFLRDTVIVSDDAGQFTVGQHALCWVHAERLVHKLDTFTDQQRAAQKHVRSLIWRFYADLKAYRTHPTPRRRQQLRVRFDRIFCRRTGFVSLDRLLARLHANKAELLAVLDYPEIPLHTNGSENDIRCHVTKRKVSGGTRSDVGRDCRDAFLGLAKTCAKLGVAFWDYLGSRLGISGQPEVSPLPELIRCRGQPA